MKYLTKHVLYTLLGTFFNGTYSISLAVRVNCESSLNLQKAFANFIWCGLLHSASKIAGFATIIKRVRALETATLKRFGLNRKSIPRGASSKLEVATE